MRKILVAAAILLAAAAARPVSAGPLLDDYLNYARLGEKCPGGRGEVVLTTSEPIGQTFNIAPGTGEIYRIGIQANSNPDSWGEGEAVTLSLYDSPSKTRKLGTFTIDWQTCRVQVNKNSDERVLLFPLRVKLSGEKSLYLELTMTGGDGKIKFRSVPSEGYADGEGYLAGKAQAWDLSFETHIKPTADKTANLKTLFDRFDLDYPALAAVKAAVQAGDYDKAEEELVKHFENRKDLYEESISKVAVRPDYDRTYVDMFINGKLYKTQDGKLKYTLPWRKQSYWAPEYVNYGRDFDVNIHGGWHLERETFGAYSATGDEKYARAGIELRVQWMMDNCPNPKVTGIGNSHEVWNELASNGRTPGHLPYVYSRVRNYPGITTDERMLYFLNWFENAEYIYKSDVGGNWGFQTANACRNFGLNFPEYKKCKEFIAWGSERLVDLTMETVREDGTQDEASIKYHAMCARRLKDMLADHESGAARLADSAVPVLKKHLERMYEHMMHTLQPDSNVVMCGDAWYENYTEELAEVGRKVGRPDFVWAATQGKEGTPPKDASVMFPLGGYYIMRSDFGGNGKAYTDARQLFIHNGGWVGSHGHWDLTSAALYAYGRTLLVDPGGMWKNPEGITDAYWTSKIHNMLVPQGWDCTRDPGSSKWISCSGIDYFDGVHSGYSRYDIPEVRRRVVFVKPGYWVVQDSATGKEEIQWDQVWNVLSKEVKVDPVSKAVETTHPSGGNLIIWPAGGPDCEVKQRRGVAPMGDGFSDSRIVNYSFKAVNPYMTTVLYPYKDKKPQLAVSQVKADNPSSQLVTAVKVQSGKSVDLIAWGDKTPVTYNSSMHLLDGEMVTVRTLAGKNINGYSCYNAKRAVFNGNELVKAGSPIAMLDVVFSSKHADIQVREPDSSIVVWVGDAKTISVNGKVMANAKPYKGYLRLFPSEAKAIIVDDSSAGFRRITGGNEWAIFTDNSAYGLTFTNHETDPGRSEAGAYSAQIPASGVYKVEVFIPKSLQTKTDKMNYTIKSSPGGEGSWLKVAGAVKIFDPDAEKGIYNIVVDQRNISGWIDLGDYYFDSGNTEFLTATNRTSIDGLHPAFDAVRLTKK